MTREISNIIPLQDVLNCRVSSVDQMPRLMVPTQSCSTSLATSRMFRDRDYVILYTSYHRSKAGFINFASLSMFLRARVRFQVYIGQPGALYLHHSSGLWAPRDLHSSAIYALKAPTAEREAPWYLHVPFHSWTILHPWPIGWIPKAASRQERHQGLDRGIAAVLDCSPSDCTLRHCPCP